MILLLGGTSETAVLAAALLRLERPVLVSTATGEPLALPAHPRLRRRSGALDRNGLAGLIRDEGIRAVVDATHPYAREIRANAKLAAAGCHVPYLSYLRPAAATDADQVARAPDHAAAARLACAPGKTVLLTVGSRHVGTYAAEAKRTGVRCIARVLDAADSLAACREAGLAEGDIVAARGPFGVAENLALITGRGVAVLVTKDSGVAGGLPQKLEAARQAGCRVVLVERPPHEAGESFDRFEPLVARLAELLGDPGG